MGTGILVCLTVASLLGPTTAGLAGREFVAAFLENLRSSYGPARLELLITAWEPSTSVTVSLGGFSWQLELAAGQVATVTVPASSELGRPGISDQTVLVLSNHPVSVSTFSLKRYMVDASALYPVRLLGTDYLVFTPPAGPSKDFAVSNTGQDNRVVLTLTQPVTFEGRRYGKGVAIRLTLRPYQTVQFQHRGNLTGSRVQSEHPVAVTAGHSCSKAFWSRCNHVYEQLPPVSSWGDAFVVPPSTVHSRQDTVYVLTSQDTELSLSGSDRRIKVSGVQLLTFSVSRDQPLSLTSTRGVLVLYYSPGDRHRGTNYNPYLMTVKPNRDFASIYVVRGLAGFDNHLSVVARTSELSFLRLDGRPLLAGTKWRPVPDSGYSWADLQTGNGQETHVVSGQNGARLGVYQYGVARRDGYGYQGSTAGGGDNDLVDPCSKVRCRSKERCSVQDGEPVCVPESSALCWAWGDPHYHTFDGVNFDFQGTCTYTIAKTCGKNTSLSSFSVRAKNDNRGNTQVAYVKLVTIDVYGTEITLRKFEYSLVWVNGIKTHLPLSLQGGRVTLFQSGASAVLETDFHLRVSYDWDHHLVVTASSSHFGTLCGLCGNYNGKADDDFRTPGGEVVSDVLEFGRSWKVPDGDAFCWNDCNGACPTCGAQEQGKYRGPGWCGLLALTAGPFRGCLAGVDPAPYVDSCVYDVCLSDGDRALLCRALKVYADACQGEGIEVGDWRKPSGCPLTCPDNSHYEACGSACPPSCAQPSGDPTCGLPCVETCACNAGYVQSAGRCVERSRCGCLHEGRYYEAGETFLEGEDCQQRCRCDPLTKKIACAQHRCGVRERCQVWQGARACHPAGYGTCSASGDPHYITFDGVRFDFQGTCVYTLAALCANGTGLPPFTVQVQNENRGSNQKVSYTRMVRVTVYGQTLVVSREQAGRVLVDDVLVNLPYHNAAGTLHVRGTVQGASLETDFGLRVTYNWHSRATVRLPTTYAGSVCGLCGDFNGDPKDDLPAGGPRELGERWRVAVTPGCVGDCGADCGACDAKSRQRFGGPHFCGLLLEERGPFRDCRKRLDPRGYFEDCVFDTCQYKGHQTALCQAVESYVAACQEAGLTVHPWRNATFCPPSCPPHSHYETCGPPCPPTCGAEPGECDRPCAEGCQCDGGRVWSGSGPGASCVAPSACGCSVPGSGLYLRPGQQAWLGADRCRSCLCRAGGALDCSLLPGPVPGLDRGLVTGLVQELVHSLVPGLVPVPVPVPAGGAACQPPAPGHCQAAGHPHYLTLDGRAFDFQGSCAYLLAGAAGDSSHPVAPFSVTVVHRPSGSRGRGAVGAVAVELMVGGRRLLLERGGRSSVKVDGVLAHTPLILDGGAVRVYPHGHRAVMETDFGLAVSYDLASRVTVTVPGEYRGLTRGLCGDFNGEPANDFRTPEGKPAPNADSFGRSWVVKRLAPTGCQHGCGRQCPECPQERLSVLKGGDYCGILTSDEGPLSACHAVLPPARFFTDCLYDTCLSEGDLAAVCESVQAYATACQALNVTLKPWRTKSFCPMKCPVHSHYESCADTCRSTCAGLTEQSPCPAFCSEGCECDPGFLSDGDRCVPVDRCGCLGNGRYYQLGETVVQEGCTQRCSCSQTGLVCEAISCAADEHCVVKDGLLDCYNKDPCKAARCREKEVCRVQEGVAKCVPQYTKKCWAWGDPHYHTLDGLNYDFQGTCTYVVAESCGTDTTLPSFKVTAKNDVRGNTAVSYVKLVHVDVYGYRISIRKMEMGLVRINDMKTRLPVTLEEGKLRLFQRGSFAVLETDFGLEVSYEWNWYLTVTLTSSHFRSVCGLCGNFNGVKEDDVTFPNGTRAPSTVEWARSWKVPDHDPFCWDYCRGYCPTCSDADRALYGGPQFCGMLEEVFKGCHPKVDHRPFVDSCIYDVCLNQGSRKLLCQALEAYASECQKGGVTVKGWRAKTSCPLECPPHSHYSECARACPPSCVDPEGTAPCPGPCAEACVCDRGHVLQEGECRPAQTACGCMYAGLQYRPGEVFWPEEGCRLRCECQGRLRMAVCREGACGPGETCGLSGGARGCVPATYATCAARGDPHYTTFDGARFDFMGTCVYQLSGLCEGGARGDARTIRRLGLDPFEVLVENHRRGSLTVSYTQAVTLVLNGTSLAMSVEFPWRVLVDGVQRAIPMRMDDGRAAVLRKGRAGEIWTDFGLTLTFDWISQVTLTLPSTYAGSVCGLCGDYDGNARDDLRLPSGQVAQSVEAFGEAWKVSDVPGCVSGCGGACPLCSADDQRVYGAPAHCGRLTARDGPFRDCHSKVDPQPFFQDCLYDICLYRGRRSVLCEALGQYMAACQSAGATVHPWRSSDFCELPCPRNSHYTLCGPPCPDSCSGLEGSAECSGPCLESCQCDGGHILSGGQCVPLSQCGCLHQGSYLSRGEVFYQGSGCQERCKCQGDGQVTCRGHSCRDGEHCRLQNGVRGCFLEEVAKCLVSGDSHYTDYTGRRFDFQGACAYVLSRATGTPGGPAPFQVVVENRPWGNGKVSVTRQVSANVSGHQFVLESGVRGKVKVDGEWYNVPFELVGGEEEEVWGSLEGTRTVLQTSFGLEVSYDGVYQAEVRVPSTYRGRLGGLCGDYARQRHEDFVLPGGGVTRNVSEFGTAWRVPGGAPGCDSDCGPSCSPCPAGLSERLAGSAHCGRIKDPAGPFAACLTRVDPGPFLQDCVFDLCAARGERGTLCEAIRAYALACQREGVPIGSWRSKDFCPLPCPANSHYQLCVDSCGTSCASTVTPTACDHRCSEGCQCDQGFAMSGNECVHVESCGCIHQGRYLKANESIYTTDCAKVCTCHSTGTVMCQKAGCRAPQVCLLRQGRRGCARKEGVCSVEEGRTLTGFEGRVGPVEAAGTYVLATVSDTSSADWFRVLADFRACGGKKGLGAAAVYAYFQGAFIVVTESKSIWVNGRPLKEDQLPLSVTPQLSVRSETGGVVLDLAAKVRLHFRGFGDLALTVDNSLRDQLQGACGTFEESGVVRLLLPDGEVAGSVRQFLRGWWAAEFSGCETSAKPSLLR
ncbi:IgGFc-binding protein [Pristis pectinata]|uniref:IgGFc-binding protein n=1 Tax=Pristis pectinata TaxID=685728 RepID=UPI00223DBD45|nr:IgGFc-binding protein [Pristis pectinata]